MVFTSPSHQPDLMAYQGTMARCSMKYKWQSPRVDAGGVLREPPGSARAVETPCLAAGAEQEPRQSASGADIERHLSIGYEAGSAPLTGGTCSQQHADVVSNTWQKRLPELVPSRKQVHCSPFGIIPKRGRLGKWLGRSVNDGISKELASLSYVSVM